MQLDLLLRLQQWYASQCNGDWEHQFGVRVDTLDNSGWPVRIDLVGTLLEDRLCQEIAEGASLTLFDSPCDYDDSSPWRFARQAS